MKAQTQAVEETYSDEVPTLGDLEDILGLHIALAHGVVYRNFMDTFAHLEMTQKQVACLWLVGDHPGIAQTDLARLLQIDRATIMAIVNRLQARDYLARGKSNSDRRRQTLDLTPTGVIALEEAKSAIRSHETWLKAHFSDKELATLISLLRRIHEQTTD